MTTKPGTVISKYRCNNCGRYHYGNAYQLTCPRCITGELKEIGIVTVSVKGFRKQ